MAAFPTLPQPGAQMGSVPGGGGSQNTNPLGQAPMLQAAQASPVAATLPGGVVPMHSNAISASGNLQSTLQLPGGAQPITVPGSTVAANTNVAAAGGFSPSTGVTDPNAATQEAGSKTMLGDFQQTYGQGTGTALANTLGGLGTSTSIAEQNMINATMGAAQLGWGNIESGMGARGVSADSSTAGLAAGDYWGQVSQGIASETGQIGLNEENTLINALTGEGSAHGSDVSGWQTFGNVMQGVGSAALGLGEAYLTGGMAGTGSITAGLGKIFNPNASGKQVASNIASQTGIGATGAFEGA